MHQTSVKTPVRPKSTTSHLFKSPTANGATDSTQAKSSAKPRTTATPPPTKHHRPRSTNQSFDFALDSSKMFIQANRSQIKFDPEAIPTAQFDLHACREEISRLESQLKHSALLENRMLRNDWREAKRSVDLQYINNLREHDTLNQHLQLNFKNFKENKLRDEKALERRRKEEEYFATKEAKLRMEMEEKKRGDDDLNREKKKHLIFQEVNEGKRARRKCEMAQERANFREFVGVVKNKEQQEQLRETKEREFEYAQNLGARWLHLHKQMEVSFEYN